MGIFDDALASIRAADLSADQAAALDQIGAAIGTIDSLQVERDRAVSERNELLGKYTSLLETNMRLAMGQAGTPVDVSKGGQATDTPDPYSDVPRWEITDLFGNGKKD